MKNRFLFHRRYNLPIVICFSSFFFFLNSCWPFSLWAWGSLGFFRNDRCAWILDFFQLCVSQAIFVEILTEKLKTHFNGCQSSLFITLPFWNILWWIAKARSFIKHLTKLASISAWHSSINTNVEILTIFWICVSWMCYSNRLIHRFTRELENIYEYLHFRKSFNLSHFNIYLLKNNPTCVLHQAMCKFQSLDWTRDPTGYEKFANLIVDWFGCEN